MAIRTISAAGGNWNSTATWVGGVIPTSSDSVLGDATSGQLTVNVSATIQFVDFTNYTQTLTTNSQLTLGLAGATSTFGSSMSFAGNVGTRIVCNVNHTFVQNTTNRIVNLAFGAGTKTLSTNLYVNRFGLGATTSVSNGNNIYIDTQFYYISASNRISGTSILILDGNVAFEAVRWGNSTLIIDAPGSTITPDQQISPQTRFEVLNGTIDWSTSSADYIQPQSNNTTLKLTTSQYFNIYPGVSASLPTINFEDTPIINTLYLNNTGDNTITTNQNIQIQKLWIDGFSDAGNNTTFFDTTYTYEIGEMRCLSQLDFRNAATPVYVIIRSNTPATQSKFNFTGNVSMNYYVDFTDIDASFGNTIYTLNGTLSNTNNIQVVSSMGASGGQTAYTFFS